MTPTPVETDHRLDVREVDGEPFSDIVAALNDVAPEESLLLVNSFEPEPLYDVLEDRGFTYKASNPEPDVWHVKIEHA